MKNICLHFYVSGRVQGVYYRNSTQRKAEELGISGWVKNLADGRVEVLACGPQDKIEGLSAWLWQGPRAAEVTDVTSEEVAWTAYKNFEIR